MRKFAALFIGSLLAGCTTLPQTPPAEQDAAPANLPEVKLLPETEPAPRDGISAELLYQILVAEVAGQRGELKLSANNYLAAARATRDPRITRRAVHIAVFGRDYEQALEGARLWVELEPDNVEARQSLAALQIRAGELDAAIEHLRQVIAAFPDDKGQGFGLVTNLLSREKNGEHALAVMRRLLDGHTGDPEAQFAYASLAANVGEHEEALKSLEQVLPNGPQRHKALMLKATVLHRMGERGAAVDTMGEAVALAPEDADLRLSYARLLVDADRLDAAREQFGILDTTMPGNPDIAYALGLLAMEAEEFDTAERYFRRLLNDSDRKNEAAYALGQIAENRDDPKQAVQWYESVAGDNFMDARLRIAYIIGDREGLDAARAYLAGLELNLPEQRLRRYLAEGALVGEAEAYTEAMAIYSEGLKAFAGNSDLLYARAMAAEKLGRIDLLEQDLQTILKQDPANTQALNALGYTLADRTQRYEEAFDYIERAYAQAPDDPAVIDSMGWVLYRMGQNEKALRHLRRALELQQDAEIAAHLGEVLWVSGEREKARAVWDEALEYAPDHAVLKRAVERFTQ